MRIPCIFFSLALAGSARGADLELFRNGGFEQGTVGWTMFSKSGTTSYESDAKVKSVGAQSLRFARTGGEGWDFLKQFVDLPAGHDELVLRMAYKIEKGSRLEANFYFFDSAGKTLGRGPIAVLNEGRTKRFERVEQELEIPEGATRCGLDLILKQKGTVWIDEVSVTIPGAGLPELGPLELANPDFEAGLDFWTPLEHGSGRTRVELDKRVKAQGKAALRLERKSPRWVLEDGVRAGAPSVGRARKARLSISVRVSDGAQAVVVLQVFDARGVALATERRMIEPAGKSFEKIRMKIALPKGSERLEVSLCIRGAGEAWFDALELKKG